MWMKDEDKLVEEVLQGKHSSFELLLQPYRHGFLNMAYRITGDREEAQEVCQDALLKIFKYLKSFKKGRSFKTWSYKVLMNTSYDYLRGKKKYKRVIESQKNVPVYEVSQVEQRVWKSQMKEKIQSMLDILSPKEKAVFLLRDSEGLSVRDASLVLGCSQISVRTHLSRARQKIKAHFEKNHLQKIGEVKS
jgi:RNA polymerase sigma-70 factor (ECF subfamily)